MDPVQSIVRADGQVKENTSVEKYTTVEESSDPEKVEIDPMGLGLFPEPETAVDNTQANPADGEPSPTYKSAFELRNSIVKAEGGHKIHHFNWAGNPVYERSGTDPQISLWFMLTTPKLPYAGQTNQGGLWKRCIIKRAMMFIDPVIVDCPQGTDIPRYPPSLTRYAKDRTFKFYSRHGWWTADKRERSSREDEGYDDVLLGNTKVGRGYVPRTDHFPSKLDWDEARFYAMSDAANTEGKEYIRPKKRILSGKRILPTVYVKLQDRVCTPSLLRHSITMEELDAARAAGLEVHMTDRSPYRRAYSEETLGTSSRHELRPCRATEHDGPGRYISRPRLG
ncbi:hypothetical protein BJX61DRAFT_262782 [Aspergillus egyptiacus]|nr:hypothetical protein BJX61DRAFT_262782 [Aspergillus egyptiacus]